MDKSLLEKREINGVIKYKLIESMMVKPHHIKKINFTEQTSKKVLHEGKEYKAIAVYSFPVSRPGQKNYNERIYTEGLWNRIIKEGMGENSFGLMGHPDDDGNPKDAWCVWKNVRLEKVNEELFAFADAWLFGPYGQQVNDGILAGSGVGLSTVGYGDFEEDQVTIREADYDLCRVADHVLEPSYGVFGTLEDRKVEKKEERQVPEIKENKDILLKETNTNIVSNIDKKDDEMSVQTSKLVEKNFRFFVESKIKEISNAKDLKERYTSYNELLCTFDEDVDFANDIKEKIEKRIAVIREEWDKLAEKGKELDGVKESEGKLSEELKVTKEEFETVQKKYNEACKVLEDTKLYTNKVRDLLEISKAEKNGMITATEYKELSTFTEEKEAEILKLKEEILKLKEEKKDEKPEDKKDEKPEDKKDDKEKKEEAEEKKDDEKKDDEKEDEKKEPEKKEEAEEKKDEKPEDEKEDEKPEDEKKDEKEDEKKEESKKKKESFTLDLRNDIDVRYYYEDLEKVDPRVKLIKEDIIKCKTVMEAQRTFLRLKDLYEDTPSPYKTEKTEEIDKDRQIQPQIVSFKNIKRDGWF